MIETCLETKLLDLHADKSCYILTGNIDKVKLLHNQINQNAITLYGKPLKEKQCEKYLGDMIHSEGNAASVAETVKTRSGKVASYIFEARAIIDDTRINTVGGLKAGLDMWEMAYLPSLLNNCQTWVQIEDATIDKLDDIQNTMYRTLLSTPKSTPWPALVWDLGGIKMKFRIMQKKLMFANLVVNQKETSLAHQIAKIQDELKLPGLISECKQFITDLTLPNIFEEKIKKNVWKNMVKRAILRENERELKEDMKKFRKLKESEHTNEKFGIKNYIYELKTKEARALFKHRCKMTRYIKMNYKNEPKYSRSLWKCENCANIDSESHILWCKEYTELREGKNLKDNKDLAEYLQKVITLREKKEKKTQKTFSNSDRNDKTPTLVN